MAPEIAGCRMVDLSLANPNRYGGSKKQLPMTSAKNTKMMKSWNSGAPPIDASERTRTSDSIGSRPAGRLVATIGDPTRGMKMSKLQGRGLPGPIAALLVQALAARSIMYSRSVPGRDPPPARLSECSRPKTCFRRSADRRACSEQPFVDRVNTTFQ